MLQYTVKGDTMSKKYDDIFGPIEYKLEYIDGQLMSVFIRKDAPMTELEAIREANMRIQNGDAVNINFDIDMPSRYWKYLLLSLVNEEVINRIIANGFNEEEISKELGITCDEFINPTAAAVKKVATHLTVKNKKRTRGIQD